MPRTAGVSASSTVWLIFFSPSPRTVSRWRCLVPASPFTRRTLSLFTEDFLDPLAAARRDLRRRAHRLQAVQRGAHHVVGVGRAEALGEDVGDADHLGHGAHRPARDDARALVSRLHQDPRRAPAPGHGVMQGAVLQLYLEKLAPRLLHRLLHGHRHLARLALTHADAAVAVADHGERGEAEYSAALHYLGDAVDRDHLLAQAVAALFRLLHPWLDFCHKSPGPRSLEFKSGGARRLRERLHAPMVFIAGAVESNLLDPLFLPLDGDALADDLGGFAVAAVLQLGPDVLLQRGSARNDLVACSGSELGIDVPVGAMHGETHRPDGADPEPGLACAPPAREGLVDYGVCRYFFLVSFQIMISPLYRTPFSLYGSGAPPARTSAAPWAPPCLSAPGVD